MTYDEFVGFVDGEVERLQEAEDYHPNEVLSLLDWIYSNLEHNDERDRKIAYLRSHGDPVNARRLQGIEKWLAGMDSVEKMVANLRGKLSLEGNWDEELDEKLFKREFVSQLRAMYDRLLAYRVESQAIPLLDSTNVESSRAMKWEYNDFKEEVDNALESKSEPFEILFALDSFYQAIRQETQKSRGKKIHLLRRVGDPILNEIMREIDANLENIESVPKKLGYLRNFHRVFESRMHESRMFENVDLWTESGKTLFVENLHTKLLILTDELVDYLGQAHRLDQGYSASEGAQRSTSRNEAGGSENHPIRWKGHTTDLVYLFQRLRQEGFLGWDYEDQPWKRLRDHFALTDGRSLGDLAQVWQNILNSKSGKSRYGDKMDSIIEEMKRLPDEADNEN